MAECRAILPTSSSVLDMNMWTLAWAFMACNGDTFTLQCIYAGAILVILKDPSQ